MIHLTKGYCMGAYSNFCSFWQNLTGKILNLAIFRQDKFLKSPKLNIFLVRFCQKVPIIFQDLYGGRLFKMGAYSSAFYRNYKAISISGVFETNLWRFENIVFLKPTHLVFMFRIKLIGLFKQVIIS